jgi:hypothetical protein
MTDPPVVTQPVQGGTIVKHREYLQDIVSSESFSSITIPINPGLSTSFPWLSGVAANFEEYILHGLVFEFKTTSSDVILSTATSTALGSVIMATQYNSLSPPFTTKLAMENYDFAVSCKPSVSMLHPIECKYSLTPINKLFVRTGTPASGDLRLYDIGVFQCATVGMQANGGTIGELWCTFELELLKPKLYVGLGLTESTDHWVLGSVTNAAPLGTTSTLAVGSTINGTITTNGLSYYFPTIFPPTTFLMVYQCAGGSATLGFTAPSLVNATYLSYWNNDANGSTSNTTSTAGRLLFVACGLLRTHHLVPCVSRGLLRAQHFCRL